MELLGVTDGNLTALSRHQSIGVPQPETVWSEELKKKYLPRCARVKLVLCHRTRGGFRPCSSDHKRQTL